MPVEDIAFLTYQAMANSDNIVLVLERDSGAKTKDAVIVASNAAFCRVSGYSEDQLVGRAAADLFPAGDDAQTLMNAIFDRDSLRSELACSRAAGDTFMLGMHLMAAPARAPDKDCFVILGRDISVALQTQQMQDSIQHLLAKVFSSVDAAVAIVSAAGRIVMTNPACNLLLGYAPNELVGRPSLELVAPESRALVTEILRQQFAAGGDTSYSATVLRADGSELAVVINSVIETTGDLRKFRIITLRPVANGAAETHSETVGQIKLVGLDGVRAVLGDRWPAVAERAMATAEMVIKRRCGTLDTYSRAGDTSFLVCFGASGEEAASFRAAMIGREIRNRLIGQGERPDDAYVRSVAAVVRFADQRKSNPSFQATLMDGLNEQIARLEQKARQTLNDALTSASYEVEPVFGRTDGQVVAYQIFLPNKLECQVTSALAALPLKESSAFDQDGLLVGLAAHYAVASMAKGDATPLLVEISFAIFASRLSTKQFLDTCGRIDPRVTSRLILILTSLPNGLPKTRLLDCVNRLRPFCRGVGYLVDELADLSRIDLLNSFNAIIAFPAGLCTSHQLEKLKQLFISLQSRRAKVLITEVVSEKHAAMLALLGADMIEMKRQGIYGR